MSKIILPLLFLCSLCGSSYAQQLPLFTQYRDHATIINPAMVSPDYLGFENNITIGASYRTQWIGISNNPNTQTIHADFLQADSKGIALMTGGYIINDQTGPTAFTGLYGKIGGMITDDPYYGGLAFGLTAGVVQYRIAASEIRLRDQLDVVPLLDQAKIFPDVGIGVFYYKKINNRSWFDDDYVYGGLSIPQVIGLDIEFSDITGRVQTKRIQHLFANIGWYKFFDEGRFIEFSAWGKYTFNTPITADFNIRYQMNSGFWIGTGASTNGNYHLETGFVLDERFRVGYGFDYSFNSYGPNIGSTHEINLNYAFSNQY